MMPGPDRKACKIRAADARRDSLAEAEKLYRLAIDDTYASMNAPARKVDPGYRNLVWEPQLSGNDLLVTQTFAARVGLASLFALHNHYSQALPEWNHAITLFRRELSERYRSSGITPAYSDYDWYITAFLREKAGLAFEPSQRLGSFPIHFNNYRSGVFAMQAFKEADYKKALVLSADALSTEISFKTALGLPSNGRYWRGILPSQTEFENRLRTMLNDALAKLQEQEAATASGNIILLINTEKNNISAHISARLRTTLCSHRDDVGPGLFPAVVAIRAKGSKIEGTSEIPLPKASSDVEVTVGMVDPASYPRILDCATHTIRARFCALRGKKWIQLTERSCERD